VIAAACIMHRIVSGLASHEPTFQISNFNIQLWRLRPPDLDRKHPSLGSWVDYGYFSSVPPALLPTRGVIMIAYDV